MLLELKVFLAILPIFLLLDYLWLGRLMPGFLPARTWRNWPRAREIVHQAAAAGRRRSLLSFARGHRASSHYHGVDPLKSAMVSVALGIFLLWSHSLRRLRSDQPGDLAPLAVRMAAVDICWGGVLCATVTLAAVLIGSYFR